MEMAILVSASMLVAFVLAFLMASAYGLMLVLVGVWAFAQINRQRRVNEGETYDDRIDPVFAPKPEKPEKIDLEKVRQEAKDSIKQFSESAEYPNESTVASYGAGSRIIDGLGS